VRQLGQLGRQMHIDSALAQGQEYHVSCSQPSIPHGKLVGACSFLPRSGYRPGDRSGGALHFQWIFHLVEYLLCRASRAFMSGAVYKLGTTILAKLGEQH